jgi:hypothetical protein
LHRQVVLLAGASINEMLYAASMPGHPNDADRFVTALNSWKRLALAAIVGLGAVTALFLWASGNRVETRAAVAAREPDRRLDRAPGAEPTDGPGPGAAAGDEHAERYRRQAPRTVSEEQAGIAAEVLRGFPLDQRPLAEPVTVLALLGDDEAADYAKQLAKVLNEAGWATTLATTTVRYNGVMCLVDNAAQFPVHARVLTFALERAGIACIAANNGGQPSNRIEIVVGRQPAD